MMLKLFVIFICSPFLIFTALYVGVYFAFLKKTTVVNVITFNVAIIGVAAAIFDTVFSMMFISEYNNFRTNSRFYHHGMKPYMDVDTKWGDTVYRMRTNSLGLPDYAPREVELEPKGKRIVFIGDSFTEGVGNEWKDTFAGIVQKRLAKDNIELLSAGNLSYSPKLYYLKLKYLMSMGLKFDELYVFIDISDVQDEIVYEYFKPAEKEPNKYTEALNMFFYQHSFFYRKLAQQMFDSQKNPYKVDSDYWGGEGNYYKTKPIWTYDKETFDKWGRRGLEHMTDYMSKINDMCKEKGIKLHIAVYPWPEQILKHEFESLHVAAWKKFSEEKGLDFINMFPLFINDEKPEAVLKKYLIPGDVHWNKDGHAIFAAELLRRMGK